MTLAFCAATAAAQSTPQNVQLPPDEDTPAQQQTAPKASTQAQPAPPPNNSQLPPDEDKPALKVPDRSPAPAQLPADEDSAGSKSPGTGNVQLPPDEDKTTPQPTQYAFNPVRSKKEVSVGEFYFKKGDFRAAAGRFLEATNWNPGNADAWLRLGEARERMNDAKGAQAAYEHVLKISPKGKNAEEVRKKLDKLKG